MLIECLTAASLLGSGGAVFYWRRRANRTDKLLGEMKATQSALTVEVGAALREVADARREATDRAFDARAQVSDLADAVEGLLPPVTAAVDSMRASLACDTQRISAAVASLHETFASLDFSAVSRGVSAMRIETGRIGAEMLASMAEAQARPPDPSVLAALEEIAAKVEALSRYAPADRQETLAKMAVESSHYAEERRNAAKKSGAPSFAPRDVEDAATDHLVQTAKAAGFDVGRDEARLLVVAAHGKRSSK